MCAKNDHYLDKIIRTVMNSNGYGCLYWDWQVSSDEIIRLWEQKQPLPFMDRNGNKYLYIPKIDTSISDLRLTPCEEEFVSKGVSELQAACIEAAARGETGVEYEVSVELTQRVIDYLKDLCGEDVILNFKKNKVVLAWDD